MSSDGYHEPVLLSEVLHFLQIKKGKQYVDATLGGGGHTIAIAKKGGVVLGIDQDEDARTFVTSNIQHLSQDIQKNITVAQGNFRDIASIVTKNGLDDVDGVLFDLGVSSYQLDTPERGFSFLREGPLDMRMDKWLSVTAFDLLHGLSKKELAKLFTHFGEEPFANKIAQQIVIARKTEPIKTTTALADLIVKTIGRHGELHPATRVFQALRIAVNDELQTLQEGLGQSYEILTESGRIVVITFHSLEDRIVKDTFRLWETEKKGVVITKKPVVPSEEELQKNVRSRSAKVRVFEKRII